MPFDEEDDDGPSDHSKKIGLKKVSDQKSIFDDKLKKPSKEDFDQRVKKTQERKVGYQHKAADLAVKFRGMMEDKTLVQNRSVFIKDFEREILGEMIQLAMDINADPNEQEGMGSLSWITLLFKTCLSQRDRLNSLEYNLLELSKKITEPSQTIDNKKVSG